jgi:hypothetical protein
MIPDVQPGRIQMPHSNNNSPLFQARVESALVSILNQSIWLHAYHVELSDLTKRVVEQDKALTKAELETAIDCLVSYGLVTLEVNPSDAGIDVCLTEIDPPTALSLLRRRSG